MKVLFDTNALMVPEQFGVDVFSEMLRLGYSEHLVPRAVQRELEYLTKRADTGRDKLAAKVGLGLANRCQIINSEDDADHALESLAIRKNAAVFTNDKELKKRLIRKGITVIYLRQGRYLEATKKEI